MNITPEMMYWLTRCDSICIAGFFLAVASGIGFAISFCAIIDKVDGWLVRVFCLFSFVTCFACIATCVFVPSTNEMAAIYVVPKIANSQTVKDLGEGVVTLAREWLEELRPAKEGGAK